jgi:hypothetical protein
MRGGFRGNRFWEAKKGVLGVLSRTRKLLPAACSHLVVNSPIRKLMTHPL